MSSLHKFVSYCFAIFVVLVSLTSQAKAEEEYMNDIIDKTCNCLSKISDTLNTEQTKVALGVCLIESCSPYLQQLKDDYDIDISAGFEEGEKFGQLMGAKMAPHCPQIFAKLAEKLTAENDENYVAVETVTGKITKIQNEDFVAFTLKEESGKIIKLYWQTFVESNIEMSGNYPSLVGKKVTIEYIDMEYFDPKIEQYRNFHIISTLNVIE